MSKRTACRVKVSVALGGSEFGASTRFTGTAAAAGLVELADRPLCSVSSTTSDDLDAPEIETGESLVVPWLRAMVGRLTEAPSTVQWTIPGPGSTALANSTRLLFTCSLELDRKVGEVSVMDTMGAATAATVTVVDATACLEPAVIVTENVEVVPAVFADANKGSICNCWPERNRKVQDDVNIGINWAHDHQNVSPTFPWLA